MIITFHCTFSPFIDTAPDPCEKWPGNYFEKYDRPNSTLVEEMYKYGRENLALIQVMIQSPYFTKIRRDVAMTFTTYIANSGGLLGLCLGFSFMSAIEIIFSLLWFCGEIKKKASKGIKRLTIHGKKDQNQEDTLSLKEVTQNSIKLIEDASQSPKINDYSTKAETKVLENDIDRLEDVITNIKEELNQLKRQQQEQRKNEFHIIDDSKIWI